MKFLVNPFVCSAVLIGLVSGCGESASTPEQSTSSEPAASESAAISEVLLNSEPAGAEEVIAARKSAEDDAEVVVVGRIGGSENPWVDGRAAFSIVDNSLKACSDIEGDGCEKPWDYCCETDKLPTATALVKVVNQDGSLINEDARKLLNLKELQTVVVKGKAKRDDAGNLTVFANGIFVRK
ncbi:MAG: hypothetical protein KDA70_11715 [Planctomycetaceae bacterium]|nr:hypothetical protein [Planctomycetaceae bacterium]